MMFGTREPFDYFLCDRCGCLQIATIPTDLDRHYPANYYSHNATPANPRHGHWALGRAIMRQRARPALFGRGHRLARLVGLGAPLPESFFESQPNVLRNAHLSGFNAKILDVGCGDTARWLQNVAALGFDQLWGVDPFIKKSRRENGVSLVKATLIDFLPGNEGTFELVTFHHSLEHVPNQRETLDAAAALLARNGTCVVRIPALPCEAWERYQTEWVELDAPRHLYIHSHSSIKLLAEAAGMDLQSVSFDTSSFEFYGSEQYKRDIPLTDPQSLWINPASRLFTTEELSAFEGLASLANRNGTGGRAVFVFRKR
jgi:2-polyprenyl-3-methyl-5-hydroxy-6-metoxy-1,4-benzoquinol methylase